MTPRCLLAIDGTDPLATDELAMDETEVADAAGPPTGGAIFSNVKTGIVIPLVVELKHSWHFPGPRQTNGL